MELEEALGGTCLRIGCIPSKAMLESSERYHEAKHALQVHGVKVGQVELDLPTMLKRKDEVVRGRTQGVDFLFKKNKVALQGRGHDRRTGARAREESDPQVADARGQEHPHRHGSQPASLPGVEWSGDRIARARTRSPIPRCRSTWS